MKLSKVGRAYSPAGVGRAQISDDHVRRASTPSLSFALLTSHFSLFILASIAAAQTSRPASQPAAFQPGIRIDWKQHQIEVDVTVILRDAPIELFACSPKNREHEAIVRIEANPTQLYQALGLIGLAPGKPVHEENGKSMPASGDLVDLDIAYSQDGRLRQEPIEAWMRHVENERPLGRLPWVFAGSVPLEEGKRLAVDTEGTVVAVVDFSTSLIALAEHHSESNDELWLRPRTERIPLIGTKGRLIVRPAPIRILLTATGRVKLHGIDSTREELARILKARLAEQPETRIELTIEKDVNPIDEKSLMGLMRGIRIGEDAFTILDSDGRKRPIIR